MPQSLEELENRFEDLNLRKGQDEDAIVKIKGLLRKADRRRLSETGNHRKWDSVLDNLECSLDETKNRLEATSLQLTLVKRNIQEMREFGVANPLPEIARDTAAADTNPAFGVAKNILSMSIEDLANLSLEDVAKLHDEISVDFSGDFGLGDTDVGGRLELANQTRKNEAPPPGGPRADIENRRQKTLREAIGKFQRKDFEKITQEELQITLICHALLRRRVDPSPKDLRLTRMLAGCIKMLDREKARIERAKKRPVPPKKRR